jgi:hypothetical protein
MKRFVLLLGKNGQTRNDRMSSSALNEIAPVLESGIHEASIRLAQDIQEFLPSIPDEMTLFRQEVEKMLNALLKSQESEQRLYRRANEIVSEIASNQDKCSREKEEELEAYNYRKKVQVDIEVTREQVR